MKLVKIENEGREKTKHLAWSEQFDDKAKFGREMQTLRSRLGTLDQEETGTSAQLLLLRLELEFKQKVDQ